MTHSELQATYDHIIVGGGVAADKAARAIHERTPDATVLILTRDPEGPRVPTGPDQDPLARRVDRP